MHTLCKPYAHCANWYYFFTPSLLRANRVNQSKHFTMFANYLHRFFVVWFWFGQSLILVYTRFETGQRAWRQRLHLSPSGASWRGWWASTWPMSWCSTTCCLCLDDQPPNGLHKVCLSLQLVYLKDPTSTKGLHKVWINWVYQCKLMYLFAQGLYLVYIWFTSNAD